jgi:hypothetical protein
MMRQIIIIMLCFTCMASSCEKPLGAKSVDRFLIKNESNLGISYLVSEVYPDTLIPNDENNVFMLAAGEKESYDQNDFDVFFAGLPADTLSIFFFSNDTLEKYSFQQIRSSYNILKRQDFGLQYFENSEYIIKYP